MIQSLGRRLSLIFDRGADGADATGASHPGAAVLHPLVDFVAPNTLPVRRWQSRQWHIEIRTGSPSQVRRSCPQMQDA